MKNQQGFVSVSIFMVIFIGLVALLGGAYYVMQYQAPTTIDNIQAQPKDTLKAEVSEQNPVKQDNLVKNPSATIDPIVLTSSNRVITGTASGISSINVGLYYHTLAKFNEWTMVSAGNVAEVPVVNGRWSFTVSGSDELVNGTIFRVIYDGPQLGTNDAITLSSSTVTTSQ